MLYSLINNVDRKSEKIFIGHGWGPAVTCLSVDSVVCEDAIPGGVSSCIQYIPLYFLSRRRTTLLM